MARDGLTVSCWAGQLSGVVLIPGGYQVGEEGGRGGAQEPRPLAQPTGQPLQALFRVRNRLKNGRYYLLCCITSNVSLLKHNVYAIAVQEPQNYK